MTWLEAQAGFSKRFSERIKRGNVLICAKLNGTLGAFIHVDTKEVFLLLTASQHLIFCLQF